MYHVIFSKAVVKPFTRTRKGKIERVKGYVREGVLLTRTIPPSEWKKDPILVADAEVVAKRVGVSPDSLDYQGIQKFNSKGMHMWDVTDPSSPKFHSAVYGPIFKLTKKEKVTEPAVVMEKLKKTPSLAEYILKRPQTHSPELVTMAEKVLGREKVEIEFPLKSVIESFSPQFQILLGKTKITHKNPFKTGNPPGAYIKESDTIYINPTTTPKDLPGVLYEELGHKLYYKLSPSEKELVSSKAYIYGLGHESFAGYFSRAYTGDKTINIPEYNRLINKYLYKPITKVEPVPVQQYDFTDPYHRQKVRNFMGEHTNGEY